MKIFEVPEFKSFHWIEEYEQLCDQISPTKNYQDIMLNHYAIAPISWAVKAENIEVFSIAHFSERELVSICSENNFHHDLVNFKLKLFHIHADFTQYFLNVVMKHLEKRVVKETSVIKLDHIKQLIAEIISDLEMSKMMIGANPGVSELNVAHEQLLEAALKLMKLPGGRAFLKGSVLELVWILRAFNNVYYVS